MRGKVYINVEGFGDSKRGRQGKRVAALYDLNGFRRKSNVLLYNRKNITFPDRSVDWTMSYYSESIVEDIVGVEVTYIVHCI